MRSAPWLYRATVWVARWSLWLFYRRIEAVGVARLQGGRPAMLVANHPNYIIDALAVAVLVPGQIHFVAKGPLLDRYPLLSRFLRSIGVLPVYRREDDPRRMRENRQAFGAAAGLFEDGGTICIFAEGRSHPDPIVRTIRSGAARILLEAEARNDYELGADLIPVALYFPTPNRWGSDGVVVFGEPIDTAPYLRQHGDAPQEAVRALTARLQAELRSLALHVPEPEWARFVMQVRDLRGGHDRSAAETLEESRAIVRAATAFRAADPVGAEAYRREVEDLWMRVDAFRRHEAPVPDARAQRESRGRRARDAAALPIAMAGAIAALPPAVVALLASERAVRRDEKRAFVRFLITVPLFVSWYALLAHRAARAWAPLALMPLLGGPFSAWLALRWDLHRRRWLAAWQRRPDAASGRRGAALAAERDALLARLDPWSATDTGALPDRMRSATDA